MAPKKAKKTNDITIILKDQEIKASKEVLVSKSDYFKSLFEGPFAESGETNVDLTEVTDNFTVLETVITYLHTNKINIYTETIDELMKLSTYLQVPSLQDRCGEFVLAKVTLQNCLRYYLNSSKYGLIYLERMLVRTVESRFHDYFIYQDSTLDVSTDELKLLFDKGFFKYCTVQSMLQFTLNWTGKVAKEDYYTLANDILNSIDPTNNQVAKDKYSDKLMVNVKEVYLRMSNRRYDLWCGKPGEEFSKTFKKILDTVEESTTDELPATRDDKTGDDKAKQTPYQLRTKKKSDQKENIEKSATVEEPNADETAEKPYQLRRKKTSDQKENTLKSPTAENVEKPATEPEQNRQAIIKEYLEEVENERKKKKLPKPVLEDVLVTISPTRYMIEDFRGKGRDRDPDAVTIIFNGTRDYRDDKKDDLHKFPGPMLDVCAYVPKKREWLHLRSFYHEWPFDGLLLSECWYPWDYVSTSDDRFLVGIADDDYDYNMSQKWFSIDLKDGSARESYSDYRYHSRTYDTCETRFAQAANGTIYSVLKSREKFDKIWHEVHFENVDLRCCKVRKNKLTGAEVINSEYATVFEISSFATTVKCAKHYVKISKKSNEMIIVYYCSAVGLMRCFIADMSKDKPKPRLIYTINDDEFSDLQGCGGAEKAKLQILEGNDAFYIVEVRPDDKTDVSKVNCIYEYVYKSHKLTESKKSGVEVKDFFLNLKRHEDVEGVEVIKGIPYLQMFYESRKSGEDSLWNFTASEYNASALSEVKVDAKGSLSVEKHRPPPFACVTGMFPAKLSPTVLAKGRPIVEYLTSKKLP